MTFWIIIFAILLFSVIIFVHELGHFIAARIFGVTVWEFAIGMGPAIFTRRGKNGTKYSIRAIPIGGFCKMKGEDGEENEEDENGKESGNSNGENSKNSENGENDSFKKAKTVKSLQLNEADKDEANETTEASDSFAQKGKAARFIILAAGAAMNIILGFIITVFVVIFASNGKIATTKIDSCMSGAPIAELVKQGDKITNVNGHSINIHKEISTALAIEGGDTFDITIERNGKEMTFNNVEKYVFSKNGTTYKMMGIVSSSENISFKSALHESFFETVYMGKIVFLSLKMLVSGEAKMSDLSGPVGVVSQMSEAASAGGGGLLGFLNLLYLAAFISVNIGIMNLLPLPALDGGRIFFILIELIFRRKVPPEKEGVVHFIGLILLFGLMIFATWNDIMRFIK